MNPEYPLPTDLIMRTLEEILAHGKQKELVTMLQKSKVGIDFVSADNWNGGSEHYVMNMRIPASTYAGIEDNAEGIERIISEKLTVITREYPNHIINGVMLIPDARLSGAIAVSSEKIKQIWGGDNGIRLFLTHKAEDKAQVAAVKDELISYGIRGFVAHEDIEPNEIWQNEIEYALSSMHALAAIATPGFNASVWCHQEIGFALGRGVPLLPLRAGEIPKGFIGKIQACPITLDSPVSVANTIVDLLARDQKMAQTTRELLVTSFENANTWEDARFLKNKITQMTGFDPSQLNRLAKAVLNNQKVAEGYGVPEAIASFVKQHK